MEFLGPISGRYELLIDTIHNRQHIEVITARPLNDQQQQTLKNQLAEALGCEVKLELTVKPEIIGGIIVKKGDYVIDNSVKSILENALREVISKSKEKQRERQDNNEI